jgi:SulP family sulfate permease
MQSSNLTSLKIGYGLRDFLKKEGYSRSALSKDVIAGVTVGILAIPLSMALATGMGISPIYGLYTAIVAGFVAALAGGSRFSIAGPTASFVILLIPVTEAYGLLGLMLVTLMAGVMLTAMALLRMGRWIEYIPESITLGFTTGIASVIILLQINDLLGLGLSDLPSHFFDRIGTMLSHLSQTHLPSLVISVLTIVLMLSWLRLGVRLPGHLPSLLVVSWLTYQWNLQGAGIATVGELFGEIPHHFPSFQGGWLIEQIQALAFHEMWALMQALFPFAFALAMLGAMESLFCAVVLDQKAGTRHSPNSELLGQGVSNVVSPLFGGFASSGAIARSITNLRAGAVSPISGMIHALVVLLAIFFVAEWLVHLPMPAMAALLVMVAWRMSEFPRAIQLLRSEPRTDVWVYLTCFSMILLFDVSVAVTVGVVLASVLFVKEIAEMTKLQDISKNKRYTHEPLSEGWRVFRIQGPLFFAAADRVFNELLTQLENRQGILLQMDAVTVLDSGGLSALRRFVTRAKAMGVPVYVSELQFQPLRTLARYGLDKFGSNFQLFASLEEAQAAARSLHLSPDPLTSLSQQA